MEKKSSRVILWHFIQQNVNPPSAIQISWSWLKSWKSSAKQQWNNIKLAHNSNCTTTVICCFYCLNLSECQLDKSHPMSSRVLVKLQIGLYTILAQKIPVPLTPPSSPFQGPFHVLQPHQSYIYKLGNVTTFCVLGQLCVHELPLALTETFLSIFWEPFLEDEQQKKKKKMFSLIQHFF